LAALAPEARRQLNCLTEAYLDKFAQFSSNELTQVTNLAPQIPDEAFIFHGTYDDPELIQTEIEKAADLLIRIQLGLEEDIPVIIIFEYASQKYRVIDFATEQRKRQAHEWLKTFRQQSRQVIEYEINH